MPSLAARLCAIAFSFPFLSATAANPDTKPYLDHCKENLTPLPAEIYAAATDAGSGPITVTLQPGVRYRIAKSLLITRSGFTLDGRGAEIYWYADDDKNPKRAVADPAYSNMLYLFDVQTPLGESFTADYPGTAVPETVDTDGKTQLTATQISLDAPPAIAFGSGERVYLVEAGGQRSKDLFTLAAVPGEPGHVFIKGRLPARFNVTGYRFAIRRSREVFHLTGEVSTDTNALRMVEIPTTVAAGDTVGLNLGVDPTDPDDPRHKIDAVVERIEGDTIYFQTALGVKAENYGDRQTLYNKLEGAKDQLVSRIGDWGLYENKRHNGYGTDHGLMVYRDRRRVANVSLKRMTIVSCMPDDAHLRYIEPVTQNNNFNVKRGVKMFYLERARDTSISDITFVNGAGNLIHDNYSYGTQVKGIQTLGQGYQVVAVGNPAPHEPYVLGAANVFFTWGGHDILVNYVMILGKLFEIGGSEYYPQNVRLGAITIDTEKGSALGPYFYGRVDDGPHIDGMVVKHFAGGSFFSSSYAAPMELTNLKLCPQNAAEGAAFVDTRLNFFRGATYLFGKQWASAVPWEAAVETRSRIIQISPPTSARQSNSDYQPPFKDVLYQKVELTVKDPGDAAALAEYASAANPIPDALSGQSFRLDGWTRYAPDGRPRWLRVNWKTNRDAKNPRPLILEVNAMVHLPTATQPAGCP